MIGNTEEKTPENAPRAAADDPLDWLLPAFWAVCIFMLSTSFFSAANTSRIIVPILHWLLPAASHRTIETLHMVVRKMAHITEYAVLFLLLVRGPMRGRPAIALAICLAYAFLDEGHQIFVPSRTPALHDVALDFSGALVASLIMAAVSTPAKAR